MKKNIAFGLFSAQLLCIFCYPVHADTILSPGNQVSLSLDVEVKRGFLGIPDGIKNPGREAYIDFDTRTLTYRDFGAATVPGWDLVFTYIVRDVSMGPMGVHPVPLLIVRSNTREGASFHIDSDKRILNQFEFEAGKMLEYRTPDQPFFINTTENNDIKMNFVSLSGENDMKRFFSAVFIFYLI